MSSGKKQTYAHKYYAGWQAVLAHAGCFLRRIWVEDKEAWYGGMGNGSSRIAQQNLFGGHDVGGGGGVTGNFNYYTGEADQLPDPYLEQKLGAGNVPASRGVCSFVWKQGYFGTSNYMKDWKFRLSYVNGIKPTFIDGVTNIVIAMDSSVSMTPEVFTIFTSGVGRLMYLIGDLVSVYDGSQVNIRLIFFDNTLDIRDYIGFTEEDAHDAAVWIEAKTQVSGVSISSMINAAESFLNEHQTANSKRIFVPMHDGRDMNQAVIEQFQSMFHDTAVHQTHTVSRADMDFVSLNNLLMQSDNTPEDNVDEGMFVPWAITDNAETIFNLESWFGVRTGEPDMNPADMLWTCITNTAWGMGQSEDSLDKDSFLRAWAVLNTEDLYMSIVFDAEGETQKIIELICEHIDAVCSVDSRTNKWVLTLIRDDYAEADLIVLNESNIGSISDYEIRTAAEQINQVTVTYWEKETGKDATVTAQDPARIAQSGLVNKSITYDGFTNAATAYKAAERDLKALSSPLKVVTLNNVDPDIAIQLKEGNAFKWNWAAHGVDGAVMRVNSIDYGDDHNFGATIEAIEDVFSTPMNSVVPYVPPHENPANQAPLDNPYVRVLELQYYDAVQFATESEVNADLADEPTLSRVAVVAPRGQQNAISAEIFVDSGTGYLSKATLDYCPSAELAQAIGKMESTFSIRKVEDLEEIELGKWILVNDEHMAVTAISETEITVKRGVNYTVPQDHAAGSMILFCDDYIALDETDYFAGESLNVKALTKTGSAQLALASATEHSIEMVGLANRPYPPANVKINGEYYPEQITGALELTWSHRNRLQQTGGVPVGWYEPSVTLEPNVEYVLELYDASDVLIYTTNVGNVDSAVVDYSAVTTAVCKIRLYSVRDDIESLEAFEHTVATEYEAPYNLASTWNDATQSVDLTWEFD
ncbi:MULTISPECIES: phage tail protein [unclassified Acinetobacter]|uniref:phage tail protein n=1 Tax=unclassified Acinetobacter TaxID=196816 RepID=UPI0015D306F3|nr:MULTISPECIES: phage tail protein [unclassified Acinetobacter]